MTTKFNTLLHECIHKCLCMLKTYIRLKVCWVDVRPSHTYNHLYDLVLGGDEISFKIQTWKF